MADNNRRQGKRRVGENQEYKQKFRKQLIYRLNIKVQLLGWFLQNLIKITQY